MRSLTEKLAAVLLPVLLEDYEQGQISIKKILRLTGLHPREVLHVIAEKKIDPPIPPAIDEYTADVADRVVAEWKRLLADSPPGEH